MIFLLLIPALLLVYYYYRQTVPELSKLRRVLLFSLRTIAVLILLVLIFNPILNLSRTISQKPVLLFLEDNSYSMELHAGDKTKMELLDGYRQKLEVEGKSSGYEVKRFSFADGIDGSRSSTSLTKTLQDLSGKTSLQTIDRIVLLSDGWFRDERLDIINRLNIPIWTAHPEYEHDEFDVGINSLFYNPTTYTEDENYVIADLFADNYDGEAELSFYINDELHDKKIIDFREENLQQITFSHTFDEAGLYPIRVEIKAAEDGEHNTGNNTYPGAIRVLDKRSGVYILTDVLNWDVKYLNNALRRDERKDVKVFRSSSSDDQYFFSGREAISYRELYPDHLQMIIIVNYGDLRLSDDHNELLQRFVRNGGGLLHIGKPTGGLSEVLGVRESAIFRTFRSTVSLTPESRKYQTFADVDATSIPTIDYLYIEPMLHAEILAAVNNEERSPAIVYSEYSQGRVITMGFFNLWRWQLRGTGEKYNDFITNVTAWLSNPSENNFFAMSDKNSYFLGETVEIKLTAYDETLSIHQGLNPKLNLYNEEQELVLQDFMTFDNRYYELSLENLIAGNYRYEIIDDKTGNKDEGSFIVSDIDAERRNRGFNYPLLAYISRQTNGSILFEEELPDISFERVFPSIERKRFEIPLYRHWIIITLFLLSFCSELYLRKKWGLL